MTKTTENQNGHEKGLFIYNLEFGLRMILSYLKIDEIMNVPEKTRTLLIIHMPLVYSFRKLAHAIKTEIF